MSNLKDVKQQTNKITLKDGIERNMCFTLNAMAELEDKYGSVEEAFAQLDKGSIKAIRAVLWAGLIHESPDLTEQQVGNLIDIQYLQELVEKMGNAIGSDLPDPTPESESAVSPN